MWKFLQFTKFPQKEPITVSSYNTPLAGTLTPTVAMPQFVYKTPTHYSGLLNVGAAGVPGQNGFPSYN